MAKADFTHIKVGDIVHRMLGGSVHMQLRVTSVTKDRIWCGPEEGPGQGWSFDRVTGAEIDDELGWGPPPKYDHTGSVLVHGVGVA